MVAHWYFNDSKSPTSPLYYHLDRPPIGRLLQPETYELIVTHRTKGTEISEMNTAENCDQCCRKAITNYRMPRQGAGCPRSSQPRADDDVRAACAQWVEKNWHLGGTVTVIPIEKHNDVRGINGS